MRESDKKKKNGFLLSFCKGSSVQSFKKAFSEIMGSKIECLLFDNGFKPIGRAKKHRYQISKLLKKKKKSFFEEICLFQCSCKRTCLFVPIIQGDNIYGYIIVLHLKQDPTVKDFAYMKLFIGVALKEFQKEQELKKLYDTIRPRAIALSTIHTVHRLLTSTLDMDELIERIARLTLQVLRAEHCFIMLFDEKGTKLIPKAVINIKNNKTSIVNRKSDMLVFEKVAKTGKTTLADSLICVPLVEEDVIGVICAKNKASGASFTNFDLEILVTLAEQAVIAIKNSQLYEEQKKMAYGSIRSLGALLDAKSPHTYTHSEEFVEIAMAIAEEMRLPREEISNLKYAALLPDTGKFSIPDEILKKRGGLSREEFAVVKMRHLKSLAILEHLDFLKPATPIIMHHHERYDGTGYPDGLKGDEIPIGARIMAVADAFEAMVSSRPYKNAKASISQALSEIEKNKNTQFDPDVVDAFIAVSKKPEFAKIFNP